MTLDAARIKLIQDYIMVKTPLYPCDVALLFGTRHGQGFFCADACDLWKRGMFRKIIVSGGKTMGIDISEAQQLLAQLVAGGIPQEHILLEEEARNTGDNVIFSKKIVPETMRVDSVLCIGKISASRRFLMTMAQHWPEVRACLHPVNHHNIAEDRWYEDEEFRRRVLLEYEKLPGYIAQGFIKEITL